MAELTPMMRQYMDVKEQNPDSLLFFRLGDFYEMFGADARTASQELDLALTTRDKDKTKAPEDKIPMCGIPYHSADAYIARLIAKGYKVSICEQTEDPALAKGLVQREVIRTVTPGTVLDDACLDAGRSNYLCGVYLSDTAAGLCACDVSTGQAHVTVFTGEQRITGLINELGRFAPAEAVMNAAAYDNAELAAALENRFACRRERLGDGRYDLRDAEKKVRTQFGEEALSRLPRNDAAPLLALGGLLTYLYETQKTDLKQLDKLEWYRTGQFMELDLAARRNLELTETLRSKEKKGSLLWVLDKTKTPMGARNLRTWLQQPLMNVAAIDRRLNAVAALVDNTVGRQELRLAIEKYICQNFADPQLSLASAAEALGYTQAYISRVFHQQTGESFSAYVERLRMEKAGELLRAGGLPVYSIASQCGYNSVQVFRRAFARVYGVSPSAYQSQPGARQG